MLPIVLPDIEYWDEEKEEFRTAKSTKLKLEHSLVSISKWEAKWHVSFFDSKKTSEQLIDYIRCMSIDKEIDRDTIARLTRADMETINAYLEDPMTATTIRETKKQNLKQKVTSELVYYWMIQYGIPVEFEKWHINRLLMLIRVCSEMQKPASKKSSAELARSYRELNEARKAAWGTKG